MIDSSKVPTYSTKDTALAAYLHTEGFELIDVDSSSFPSIFHFKDDNPKIREYVHAFQSGKAEGNIAMFFRAYKIMLSELKDSKRG